MNDANGHALIIGDVVTPDNDVSYMLRIDAFDGTLAHCRERNAIFGPVMKFLPVHLIYVSAGP